MEEEEGLLYAVTGLLFHITNSRFIIILILRPMDLRTDRHTDRHTACHTDPRRGLGRPTIISDPSSDLPAVLKGCLLPARTKAEVLSGPEGLLLVHALTLGCHQGLLSGTEVLIKGDFKN